MQHVSARLLLTISIARTGLHEILQHWCGLDPHVEQHAADLLRPARDVKPRLAVGCQQQRNHARSHARRLARPVVRAVRARGNGAHDVAAGGRKLDGALPVVAVVGQLVEFVNCRHGDDVGLVAACGVGGHRVQVLQVVVACCAKCVNTNTTCVMVCKKHQHSKKHQHTCSGDKQLTGTFGGVDGVAQRGRVLVVPTVRVEGQHRPALERIVDALDGVGDEPRARRVQKLAGLDDHAAAVDAAHANVVVAHGAHDAGEVGPVKVVVVDVAAVC